MALNGDRRGPLELLGSLRRTCIESYDWVSWQVLLVLLHPGWLPQNGGHFRSQWRRFGEEEETGCLSSRAELKEWSEKNSRETDWQSGDEWHSWLLQKDITINLRFFILGKWRGAREEGQCSVNYDTALGFQSTASKRDLWREHRFLENAQTNFRHTCQLHLSTCACISSPPCHTHTHAFTPIETAGVQWCAT